VREDADFGNWHYRTLEEADEKRRVWTDDYSNVLGAVWRRLRDGEQQSFSGTREVESSFRMDLTDDRIKTPGRRR
jgi:hypothetical protein